MEISHNYIHCQVGYLHSSCLNIKECHIVSIKLRSYGFSYTCSSSLPGNKMVWIVVYIKQIINIQLKYNNCFYLLLKSMHRYLTQASSSFQNITDILFRKHLHVHVLSNEWIKRLKYSYFCLMFDLDLIAVCLSANLFHSTSIKW